MKKLTTLVLLAGLVVSSAIGATSANAAEFKPNAEFINHFVGGTGGSALGVEGSGGTYFGTQIELGFDYIASENLSATFLVRVGANEYGTGEFDAAWSGDSSLAVRLAYVDWMIPNTSVQVRMGYQPYALPAFAFGSAVLDTRGSGITIAAPINDNIAVVASWLRPSNQAITSTINGHTSTDVFTLIGDFSFDGFQIAPWVMYASQGSNSNVFDWQEIEYDVAIGGYASHDNEKLTAWLIGASFELSMFDPFTFALDAYYSSVDSDASGSESMDGFYVGTALSYATDFGTPTFKAWYATGNDNYGDNHKDGEALAIIPAFAATSIMFDDDVLDADPWANRRGGNASGTWGVLLEMSDISFVENLTHTARIAYIGGTNSIPGGGESIEALSWGDSAIEVNFNSTYDIYKNLSATLELGWLTVDFERKFDTNDADDDILRAALTFVYSF